MKTVYAIEYGITPNSDEDYTARFVSMLAECGDNTRFVLEHGRYDFFSENAHLCKYSLSNTDVLDHRKVSILIKNMTHVELDGCRSEFVFHGQVLPVVVDSSSNIVLKNFSIDWDIPLSAEGVITAVANEYVDIKINQEYYPCEVKDGWLQFKLEKSYSALAHCCPIEFENSTKTVAYMTGDNFSPKSTEHLNDDIFRISGKYNTPPKVGNIMVLRHSSRQHSGIFIENSKDIVITEIKIHCTGGLGILAQFSENINFSKVQFLPNEARGREITSGHDDGIHLSNNRGTIQIEECTFHGLMDDPVNIHGTCVKIIEIISKNEIKCRFMHNQSVGFIYWARPEHELSFINPVNMASYGVAAVKGFELLNEEEFIVSFSGDIPDKAKEGDSLENITNTAGLICRNNIFGSVRARGILISTPKPVLIENNLFDSSGCAVLVAGDANGWYESGECHDIIIRNNIFTDSCLTSMYQFCEAVISICPEIPSPDKELPFHKNIKITGNTFYAFDYPVLYALSTENLLFTGNKILRSYRQKPWHPAKSMLSFDYCKNVKVRDNLLVGEVLGKYINCLHMEKHDIEIEI